MKKAISLILLMGSLFTQALSQVNTTNISPLRGEKWWGGFVAMGSAMPFIKEVSGDLSSQSLNNQTVPFFVSSAGRYVWSEKPFKFSFKNDILTLESEFEKIEPVTAGKTLREAYLTASHKHFPPSGKTPASMLMTNPQYNTWIELMYNQNQADILKYAEGIKSNGFPAGVIMIDDNWQKYYGNYEFKPDKFPDPKAMVDKLHADGFKVMLWVCPFVSPDSPEYRDLAARGYLIKNKTTKRPAVTEWWNGFSACYDMTNPEVVDYVMGKLQTMQKEYGIDGFKFDAGDAPFYNDTMLSYDTNAIPTTHTEAWSKLGLNFEYNEYRASWKMGGQPLAQRLGDKDYSWYAVGLLIPDMLASGLMGHTFTCPDLIGGGQFASFLNTKENEFDQKLITRSAQIHALMPMMQFSVAPWRILDKTHLEYCREAALLHVKFADYIMTLAKESATTGAPIIRHLEYEFPGKGFADCSDQFMLGNKYLVAPITTADNNRKVRLPNGRWKDDKGKIYKGPLVFNVTVDDGRLLYFEHMSKK